MVDPPQLSDKTGRSTRAKEQPPGSMEGDAAARLVDRLAPGPFNPLALLPADRDALDGAPLPDDTHWLNFLFSQNIDGFFVMMLDHPVQWPNLADPEGTLTHVFNHLRLTQANEAFCDQYLAQPADLLGWAFAEFFNHDAEAGRAALAQLLDNGRLHMESEEQRLDGSILFTEHDCLCLYDHQGRVIGCCGVQRDITDLRLAVQALQQSEQRIRQQEAHLRTALEAAYMGTWEWDFSSGRVVWSESLEKLMGLVPGSFDGRIETVQAMIHPEDQDRVEQAIQRAIAKEADYTIEFRFLRADGSVRWAFGQGTVEYDDQGQPLVIRGVDVDITDRKEAEERLQESELRFRNISNNLPGAVFRYVLHPDGSDSVVYMNPGCVEIWEVAEDQILENAQALWDVVHPEDRLPMWESVQASARTLQSWVYDWRITTPAGQQKWIHGIGRPERLDNGDTAWDTIIFDYSDRKRAEQALTQTTAQLESFIANAPALVTFIDINGTYLKVNQAVADQFGFQPEEIAGKSIDQFIPTDLVPVFKERIQRVIASQAPMTVEDRLVLSSGTKIFSTVLFPIAAKTGDQLAAIGAIATDISLLVEAQQTSHRQAEEERLLRTLTQHIHQSLDVHEILQTAVDDMRRFLQTDRVLVYQFSPNWGGSVVVESVLSPWVSALGHTVEDTCFIMNPAVVERYRQGQHSQITNLSQAPLSACHQQFLGRLQVQASLVLPINYGDKLWGLLCIHHCQAPRSWHDQEIALVQQLADQLAIAIYQGQLLTQTTLMAQQEKLLNTIITAISDSLELDVLLQRAADQMLQVFNASRSLVTLCQPTDAETIHTTTSAAPGFEDLKGVALPIEGNPHAQVILAQELPVAIEDVNHDPIMDPLRATAQAYNIRAMLAVSIRYRGQVKGVLSLHQCYAPRRWSLEEQRLIKRVADHLAIAIQQAELYQQAQTELAERKRLEAKLRYDALHDKLTALPNRVLFLERLSQAMADLHQAAPVPPTCPLPYDPDRDNLRVPSGHQFAVLFLDLDRFKVVNDSLGHTIGDQLLRTVADRLQSCLRPTDTAARLGGDEFVILLTHLSDSQVAVNLARRIHATLETPLILDGYEVFVRASIGIALGSLAYTDPNHVLRDADIAMYQAKTSGREYAIFDAPMHAHAVQQMQIESDLQRAIERQEFVLYYQPIFNLSTFQIEGFEALMRWHHPTAGVVSPANFIPVAENTGLIASLDIWALNQACQQLRQWQMQYPQLPLSVSVNLSGKQFMRPDLIPQIDRALVANEVSGRFLKIEITETVLIQNSQAAIELLRQLRQRHIQICMDDFGTGYSSLSYLHRFPIDILKIDKSFIDSLQAARQGDGTQDDGTQDNGTIVRAILNLAHNLNLQVVAEGIETLYQIHYLQSHRCHSGQGYFLAKPLPVSEVPDFLTNHA